MCEAVKRLNALKHQKNTRQKKLELLQTEYNQLVTDAEEVSNTDAGESAEAQVLNKSIITDTLSSDIVGPNFEIVQLFLQYG